MEIEGQRQLKHNTNAVSARYAQQIEILLVYVRALYNNCFIIPTSAQY